MSPEAVTDSTPKTKRVPAKAVQGEKLLNLIFERDVDKGSHFVEVSGLQGSGKTSLMLGMVKRIMKNNPEELMLMREAEGSPFQASKLGTNWRILTDHPIKVFDITNGMVDVTDTVRINRFDGVRHLLRYLHPGVVNVVYFKDLYKWVDLLDALRLLPSWKTVAWDEYEDIVPEHSSGIIWKKNKQLSNSIKQIRKSRITLIANSQSNMDCDFRVRSKITMFCYCFGARLDRLSPIVKQAVSSLSVGQCWVDWGHSFFGQILFPPFTPKEPALVVMSDDSDENTGESDGSESSDVPPGHVLTSNASSDEDENGKSINEEEEEDDNEMIA